MSFVPFKPMWAKSIAIVSLCLFSTGCTSFGQRINGLFNCFAIKVHEHTELAGVRQETRESLAKQREEVMRMNAEREVQAARMEAEKRQLEIQFCQANQEAQQRNMKSNIRQSVESKIAFNVDQALEVGELEVDMEALKNLLKERENEAAKQRNGSEAEKRNGSEAEKRPCSCCDKPCGCEPGLIRRHCARCCSKPCEAEKTCGGPEAMRRLAQEPEKRPLRPAEIPMKLPVRLAFGFQNPEMEAARIKRVPIPNEQEAERRSCNRCNSPGGCIHCTQPAVPDDTKVGPIQIPTTNENPVQALAPESPPNQPVRPAPTSAPVPPPDSNANTNNGYPRTTASNYSFFRFGK